MSDSSRNIGKAALAILHGLVQANHTTHKQMHLKGTSCLVGSSTKLFPVLQSCLEDFDTSMRELSLRSDTEV